MNEIDMVDDGKGTFVPIVSGLDLTKVDDSQLDVIIYSRAKDFALAGMDIGKCLLEKERRVESRKELKRWAEETLKEKFNLNISWNYAKRCMRIAKRFGNRPTSDTFKTSILDEMLALPEGEEEAFIEAHGGAKEVNDMTVTNVREEVKAWKARAEKAEQERDDEKRKNAELDSIRANIMKQNAGYAQENHMLKMDNNALAHENEQLRNQPQAEPEIRVVEKRVEVIPDEYKKAFMENQRTHKELAAFKAHSQNMTVQELAQNDKEFSDLRKSEAQEREVTKRLEQFTFFSDAFPEGPIESRDLVTCYMKYHWHEDAIVNGILTSIKHVKDVSEWIYNEFIRQRDIRRKNEEDITKSRLEVVK